MKKLCSLLVVGALFLALAACEKTKEANLAQSGHSFTACYGNAEKEELSYEDAKEVYELYKGLELKDETEMIEGCLVSFELKMDDGSDLAFTIITDSVIAFDNKVYHYESEDLYGKAEAIVGDDQDTYIPFKEDETAKGNIPSALKEEITSSDNTGGTKVAIKEGEVVLTSKEGEELGKVEGLNEGTSLTWMSDCGGRDYFALLDKNGSAALFELGRDDKGDLKAENIQTVSFKERIVDIGIYDDTTPFTTCGGLSFYFTLESGKTVNQDGQERKSAHPYYSFFRYGAIGSNGQEEMVFLLDSANDQKVAKAKVDHQDKTIGALTPLQYEGEDIHVALEGAYLYDECLYLLSEDKEKLYVYDLLSDECKTYDEPEIEEFAIKGAYNSVPDRVVIKTKDKTFTLEGQLDKALAPTINLGANDKDLTREW